MDGFIAVNKQQNMTSHDVCFKLKKILRPDKIGHTGTLDPMACGVLVVMLGNAVRLSEYLVTDNKEYIAGIRFGQTSDTEDAWGNILTQTEPDFTLPMLSDALLKFTGKIKQVPPMYAAIKHKGKHLYEYARDGQTIELLPRDIEIYALELLSEDLPREALLKVACSKGTYIRALCRDIGAELGCGALMSSLNRVKTGDFGISNAFTIDEIEELHAQGRLSEAILPPERPLAHFPRADVRPESARIVYGGNLLIAKNLLHPYEEIAEDAFVRIYLADRFIGIGKKQPQGIKPVKIFPQK